PDDARLAGLGAEERERRHAEPSQALACTEDVVERGREGDVRSEHDRRRPDRPEAEHRVRRTADPEERRVALWHLECDLQPDDVAVERDRAVEVAHQEVGLVQPAHGDRRGHAGTYSRNRPRSRKPAAAYTRSAIAVA